MSLHPSITFDTIAFIAKAVESGDVADLYDSYCDNYKDAHGIKARWVYGNVYTADEWVTMFSQLAYDVDASIERDEAEAKALRERIASLGLTEWAERNNIRNQYDLMEYNYQQENKDAAAVLALTS